MAKYLIDRPAFINGRHYQADVRNPQVVVLPDEEAPSRTFKPLDQAAVDALAELGVDTGLAEAPADAAAPDDTSTMSELQTKKAKKGGKAKDDAKGRASDQDPVA